MKALTVHSIAVLAFVYGGFAVADDADQPRKKHRKPPKVAIEACAALTEGDPCTFVDRRENEIAGVCFARTEKALACRPDSPPPGLYREKTEDAEAE